MCWLQVWYLVFGLFHYNDVIMSAMASNHRRLECVLNNLLSYRSRIHQISLAMAFAGGIHRWPMDSFGERPVTRKMFSFDDVIIFSHVYILLDSCRWVNILLQAFTPYVNTKWLLMQVRLCGRGDGLVRDKIGVYDRHMHLMTSL